MDASEVYQSLVVFLAPFGPGESGDWNCPRFCVYPGGRHRGVGALRGGNPDLQVQSECTQLAEDCEACGGTAARGYVRSAHYAGRKGCGETCPASSLLGRLLNCSVFSFPFGRPRWYC